MPGSSPTGMPLRRYAATIFGFACCCPIILVSGLNMRLTDAAGCVAVGVAIAGVVLTGRVNRQFYFYLGMSLLTLAWISVETLNATYLPNDRSAAMILVRWLLAMPTAYLFSRFADDPRTRKTLFVGVMLGLLTDTALLGYDDWVYSIIRKPAFEPEIPFFVNDTYRASGILGHPNAAAIASCFIVPFLFGTAEEYGWKRRVLLIAAAVAGFVFYVTQTRSALMGSAALLVVWWSTTRPNQAVAGLLMLAVAVVALSSMGSPQDPSANFLSMIVDRFTDPEGLNDNAAGRMDTVINAMELVVTHPFGMGSAYAPALDARTGFEATHNAFLQLALLGGLPLAVIVTSVLIVGASRIFNGNRRTEHWVAAYLVVVCMFETVFFISFVSTLIMWIMSDVLRSWTAPDNRFAGPAA